MVGASGREARRAGAGGRDGAAFGPMDEVGDFLSCLVTTGAAAAVGRGAAEAAVARDGGLGDAGASFRARGAVAVFERFMNHATTSAASVAVMSRPNRSV